MGVNRVSGAKEYMFIASSGNGYDVSTCCLIVPANYNGAYISAESNGCKIVLWINGTTGFYCDTNMCNTTRFKMYYR
jgi:hypothetical protein